MQRWRRLLLITAVVAGLAVLFHLIHVHGLEPIRAQVEQLGVWAPLGIVVLRGIGILLPALPSTASRCWPGVAGLPVGLITIVLCDLIFCQAAFLLAQVYGEDRCDASWARKRW